MKFQPNKIKVDLASYRHYWRGVKKIGKTSMFRDLLKVAYGDYRFGLIVSPGNETGYKALDGVFAHETPKWEDFVELVDDLVENKSDNDFKLIGIDTVDELVSIAIDKTLKVHFQRKGEHATSINGALGGYGAGRKYVTDLINKQIKRLEGAGYGLVFIGHTKIRDVKEKNMEEGYQALTSNLESGYDGIFADKADVIATFYAEKELDKNTLVGTTRWIYFRTDGFVDAGSRFANMPERVEMTAENYLKAFEEGVKNSFATPVTSRDLEKLKQAEVSERVEKASQYVESEKKLDSESEGQTPETAEDFHTLIDKRIGELDKEMKSQKQVELKELGLPVLYKKVEDLEILRKILKIVCSE